MAPDSVITRYRGRYRDGFARIRQQRYQRIRESGILPADAPLSPPDSLVEVWEKLTPAQQDTLDLKMAVYAAQIDLMDQGVGHIIRKLESLGKLENTLIMFLSDNGATREYIDPQQTSADTGTIGSRFSWASYTASWANVSNLPFRLYKSWVHEGGIATPFIVHYPREIRQARINRQPGHVIDLMATCIELAQTTYPEQYQDRDILPTEGTSLVPVFREETFQRQRPLFWEHMGNRAVRDGRWKLVAAGPDLPWELYDMASDRSETQNLANQYPQQAAKLAYQWQTWAHRVGVRSWKEFTASE